MQVASNTHTVVMRLASGDFAAYIYEHRGGKLLRKSRGASKDEAIRRLNITSTDRDMIPGLVLAYKSSREFKQLSEKTQTDYGRYLDLFAKEFSSYETKAFEDPQIRRDITEWREGYSDTPRTADLMVRSVGSLFKWARSRGYSFGHPTQEIRMIHKADRSDIIWTADDFAALKKVASKQIMDAVNLAAQTGLRQGDLLRLTWACVYADHVQVVTRKRSQAAIIPLTSEAVRVLQTLSRDTPTVLVSRLNTPWTEDGFRSSFNLARNKAGITKRFHDLRGTAATRFRAAGFTNAEIALTMGWSVASVDQLMLKYVSGSDVIRAAIERVSEPVK